MATPGCILVIGATGTVGSSVVTRLLSDGEPVRAAVQDLGETVPDGAQPVRFDFAEPATWEAALSGVDRMFLIRPPAVSDVKRYLRPVIGRAADQGLRQVVFLSVMGVNRFLPHWQVERDLEASGLPHTFLRPAFFAQNLLIAHRHDIVDHDRIRLASPRGAAVPPSSTPGTSPTSPPWPCVTPRPTPGPPTPSPDQPR